MSKHKLVFKIIALVTLQIFVFSTSAPAYSPPGSLSKVKKELRVTAFRENSKIQAEIIPLLDTGGKFDKKIASIIAEALNGTEITGTQNGEKYYLNASLPYPASPGWWEIKVYYPDLRDGEKIGIEIGKIVGIATDEPEEGIGIFISNMAIDKEHRQQGLFKGLIEGIAKIVSPGSILEGKIREIETLKDLYSHITHEKGFSLPEMFKQAPEKINELIGQIEELNNKIEPSRALGSKEPAEELIKEREEVEESLKNWLVSIIGYYLIDNQVEFDTLKKTILGKIWVNAGFRQGLHIYSVPGDFPAVFIKGEKVSISDFKSFWVKDFRYINMRLNKENLAEAAALRGYDGRTVLEFVDEITPEVIERAQEDLLLAETDQHLRYLVLTDKKGNPLHRISPEDEIFIGHFRDDRASYFAEGLQRHGFNNLTGYIKFSDKYRDGGGESVLFEEATGEISDNYFEILYKKGKVVRIVTENEKKKHYGRNAHGRREKLWPNEKQVSIPMKPTTCEYADVPEMNTEKVADRIIEWLGEPIVTDIYANMLSSDMMKHTGNYKSAKKGNEVTDVNVGRVKNKIDEIAETFLNEVKNILEEKGLTSLVKKLETSDFNEFLSALSENNQSLTDNLKELSQKVPLLVLTADHGASEAGLKKTVKESNTAHTANPVPYIIYDPLNKKRISLKEGKTIRNNASTLLHLRGFERPASYEESLLPDDYEGCDRKIVKIALDGWGINPDRKYPYDAIRLADTPNYDWLVKNASFTSAAAHGEVEGLRKILSRRPGPHHDRGLQPGGTDVGHLHFFSGRKIKQPILLVDELIKGGLLEGIFDRDKEEVKMVVEKMLRAIKENKQFHHIAFSSEGGVHSCLSHMYALMRLAKKLGMKKEQFVIHFVAEGRDVLMTRSANLFLEDVEGEIEKIGIGVVATVFGRTDWVRKDGYKYQTDRVVGALTGNFEMFIDGTKELTQNILREKALARFAEAFPYINVKLNKDKLDEPMAFIIDPALVGDNPSVLLAVLNLKEQLGDKIKIVFQHTKKSGELGREALYEAIKEVTEGAVDLKGKVDLDVPAEASAKEVIKWVNYWLPSIKEIKVIGRREWTEGFQNINIKRTELEKITLVVCKIGEGSESAQGDLAILLALKDTGLLPEKEMAKLNRRWSKSGTFFIVETKEVGEAAEIEKYREELKKFE